MSQTYGQAALPIAKRYIGVKEQPAGSNDGPQVRVFRMGHPPEPWCADFGTWCLLQAGFPKPTWNWSYCPAWEQAARAGAAGMRLVGAAEAIEAGDVALYDWEGDGVVDHFGLIYQPAGSAFTAIEGNTAVGNNSNGGQVMVRSRSRSECGAIIRLPAVPVEKVSIAKLPYGGSLRLFVPGHETWAGWAACIGPMRNIERNGLRADYKGAAITWRGHRWTGAADVANVVRHLLRQYHLV